MEFKEMAQKKIQHWMKHNDQHQQEYNEFAQELEKNGFSEAAKFVREMSELTAKSNQSLEQALNSMN